MLNVYNILLILDFQSNMEQELIPYEEEYTELASALFLGTKQTLEQNRIILEGNASTEALPAYAYWEGIYSDTSEIKLTSYTPENIEKAKTFIGEKTKENIPENNGALEFRAIKILRELSTCILSSEEGANKDQEYWLNTFLNMLQGHILNSTDEHYRNIISTQSGEHITKDAYFRKMKLPKNVERKISKEEMLHCLNIVSKLSDLYL